MLYRSNLLRDGHTLKRDTNMLKIGLIGCGGMGMHLSRQCQTLDDAKITAVFDVNTEAAETAAQEFGAARFVSHAELLSSDVDGVIIATPNDSHAPLTIEAAANGKHIFCEKPMALSVADCDAMIAAAEKAGVKLMVGQVLRLIKGFWKIHEIVASGELGAPFAIFVTRLGTPKTLAQGWRATNSQSGGVLYEVHVHELDFMRHIMGEAQSVFASTGHFTHSPVEFEDLAVVQLRYANNGIGALHCGVCSSVGRYDLMILCDKGTLTSGGFGGPIRYARFDEEPVEITLDSFEKEEPCREEVRSWVEAIIKGTPMVFDAHDGRAAIELCDAAYRSAESGAVVRLPL